MHALPHSALNEKLPARVNAKEVLRYRQALIHGLRQINERPQRPLATALFVEIAQLIKEIDFNVRAVTIQLSDAPGLRIEPDLAHIRAICMAP